MYSIASPEGNIVNDKAQRIFIICKADNFNIFEYGRNSSVSVKYVLQETTQQVLDTWQANDN